MHWGPGGVIQRTNAGHEVHVCVGVGQAKPAALHRRPCRRLAALRRRGHVHGELAPHEVRAVQLAGLLGCRLRLKLHKAVAVKLPCAAQPPCQCLHTGNQSFLRIACMTGASARCAGPDANASKLLMQHQLETSKAALWTTAW